MIEARIPADELERLAALRRYGVLDTDPEQGYDDLTRIAAHICGTPIALVSLVDAERQWFKSRVGLDAAQTPRNVAFCAHAILQPAQTLVVGDSSQDERFKDNPLVLGDPRVRFYAGAPLVTADNLALGTLCVIDHRPRELSAEQIEALQALARQVVSQLELRNANATLGELAFELERKNGELQQFTSVAAHDLQEPLRQLIAFSEMLKQDLPESLPADAAEDLRFITQSSQRMKRLVSDLLRLARAGDGGVQRAPVELGHCVRSALETLSLLVIESEARVSVEPLPTVEGDALLLTQLFQNLVANALKFSRGRNPEIRVTCATIEGETVIGVEDNGIGMDPRYRDKIFAPFQRLHDSERYEGTGIGLSICRRVVERHGGRIWVESTPGRGSHFRFTLPGLVESTPSAAGPRGLAHSSS